MATVIMATSCVCNSSNNSGNSSCSSNNIRKSVGGNYMKEDGIYIYTYIHIYIYNLVNTFMPSRNVGYILHDVEGTVSLTSQ